MNTTHLHLLLNHFPIIGTLIGALLLIFGTFRKNHDLVNGSLVTILVMALIAIPVFLTGEPAEDSVENIPGVLKTTIHEHEESAELAFWAMEITGAVALIALILGVFKHTMYALAVRLSLAFSLVTFILMARTGYMGGQIRHSEIAATAVSGNGSDGQGNEKDDD